MNPINKSPRLQILIDGGDFCVLLLLTDHFELKDSLNLLWEL